MNTINYKKYLVGLVIPIIVLASCKKNFLEKPPTDAIVDANFYKTDEQVLAGTAFFTAVYGLIIMIRPITTLVISGQVRHTLPGMTGVMYCLIPLLKTERTMLHGVHSLMLLHSPTWRSSILTRMRVQVLVHQLKKWPLLKQGL